MFPNDNAFLTEQYKTYRLQLVQLPDGDVSDFRLNKYSEPFKTLKSPSAV